MIASSVILYRIGRRQLHCTGAWDGLEAALPGHGMFKRKSMEDPKLTRERLAESIDTLVTGKSYPEQHV